MRTGFTAMRLALGGLIVPFVFVYQPELLMLEGTIGQTIWVAVVLLLGIVLMSIAAEGHLMVPLPVWLRLVIVIAALGLVTPTILYDVIGAVLAAAALFAVAVLARRQGKLSWRAI